jgi:HSP20 family protein
MYETDEDVVIKATMPGVRTEDIQIQTVGKTLTIKGETRAAQDVEEGSYIRRERRFGSFARTVALPEQVDADAAEADYENGVLTVTLPKSEASKARSIEIKSK